MEEKSENSNKMDSECMDVEDFTLRPNFINTPWDDRSQRSKIGIVCLLVTIFVATIACVVNNIVIQYRSAAARKTVSETLKCPLEKIDKYAFVARILAPNGDLLCVGAVASDKSILTSEVCVKSRPILLLLGKSTLPRCKKGFLIERTQPVISPEVYLTDHLAILTARGTFECGNPIAIGSNIIWEEPVTVIGRPSKTGRSISLQGATLKKFDGIVPTGLAKRFNMDKVLCVRGISRCPVQAGDLLIQRGHIYGIASISIGGLNQVACFVDVKILYPSLSTVDRNIQIEL